jgi:predicted ATPase
MATRTSYRTPGVLPPQTAELVGRVAELARTRELLRGSRLVTITGTGGVGKTRLAVAAADDAAADYRDGVHFLELSAVREPELLMHALTAGLTIIEHSSGANGVGTQLDQLLGYLRERELLLVLDTCEHILDACAALVDTVLREAPGITILATSRQPLDAAGEAVQVLCPLPVPDPGSTTGSGSAVGKADAVELFAQRAAAAVPGFTVTPQNVADVIAICKGLDGIPLAIELATVRLRALPLHEMAERIHDQLWRMNGDRLRLLTGQRRSGAARHQTLRAAIEWSYELCPRAEQLLWARLSVFADGFGIDAAEEICADGELAREEILPGILSLADKNLVYLLTRDAAPEHAAPEHGPVAGEDRPAPTFRMLDTLREFGAEQLHLSDSRAVAPWRANQAGLANAGSADGNEIGQAEAAVQGRFIAYYLGLAEEFARDPITDQVGKLQRLSREHANLRAAFEYALELPGNDSAAILLATSLSMYWHIASQLREGEYWLDQVLDRCPKRSVVRARVLAVRASVRVLLGDHIHGVADARAAIEMAAPFNDLAAAGRAYNSLFFSAINARDHAEAQLAAESAAACYRSLGDVHGLARVARYETLLWLQAGDLERCYASAIKGLAQLPADEVWCSSSLYLAKSVVLFLRGDIDAAMSPGLLAVQMTHRIQDRSGLALALSMLAGMAAAQGRCERAAWLFGAATPLWERAGQWYLGDPGMQALHDVADRAARATLGDERYWALRAEGAAAGVDHAVARAMANADDLGAPA